MNKEQSKKYLDIVKNGNYDDMFDFGCEITKKDLLKKIEGMKKEDRIGDFKDGKGWGFYYNQALEDIKKLL